MGWSGKASLTFVQSLKEVKVEAMGLSKETLVLVENQSCAKALR